MFARFFVDRPVFATVLSLVIILVGLVALVKLPIAQYPEVTPPTVQVSAVYPGANAKTVAETVATPIEQEINGVEGMLYMASRCTNDGQMLLDVTFALGTNLDMAQVLVQNRVSVAQARLPDEVKRQGVTTKKKSPAILLCVNLLATGTDVDQLYLSNFALMNVKDDLSRVHGVGDVSFLGSRDYSIRIWLDPHAMATKNITVPEVIAAVREQNTQVAAGRLGQSPIPQDSGLGFELPINLQGRLLDEDQFGKIVVKSGEAGQNVYLANLVRAPEKDSQGNVIRKGIELGAKNYDVNSYLDGKPAVTLAVFQLPGANALETAEAIRTKMEELKHKFPPGVEYRVHYDTTVFIDESVHEVYKTLFEAFILVFVVVLVFLQDWRATLLPMIDVPVSLIGTLFVMALLGFSLNNLSLFGLVLAIGIVVDDAIVVVENIERWMAKGLPPREATIRAMDEITGPVIAITLVLSSVFVPTAFLAGISGQFFRQFALTIAASTIISAINALTMAPARAVTLIKPHKHGEVRQALPPLGFALVGGLAAMEFLADVVAGWFHIAMPGGHGHEADHPVNMAAVWGLRLALFAAGGVVGWLVAPLLNRLSTAFFAAFNKVFDWLTAGYGLIVRGLLRTSVIVLVVYAGLLGLTYVGFRAVPQGFVPEQDKGYLVVNAQLPDGAALDRSDAVMRQLSAIARKTPGVAHTIEVPGYSLLLSTNLSNVAGMFVILDPFEERKHDPSRSMHAVLSQLEKQFAAIQQARVNVFGAPPIDGLGTTGGFKVQVQDRRGAGLRALQGAVQNLADVGNRNRELVGLFSSFSVNQPQLFVEIDREKLKAQHVSLSDVNLTLQALLGSYYVNDVTLFNRNWQVNVQADGKYRLRQEDIGKFEVLNAEGKRVPLGALIRVRDDGGPAVVNHYNLYPSAEINGGFAPGVSSGQAIVTVDKLAQENLPATMALEWTDLMYQQIDASKDFLTKIIFPLAILMVVMVLAAQYESWSLPFAIVLIVPMCMLSAVIGLWLTRLDNNIFTQIGLVVLVALAAKNAILIVEFAKERQAAGDSRIEATVTAACVRLRPILMTSFAFILGVVPLVLAKGAGAEMRVALGVAVFSGMLGVTFFGLLFTPVFYSVIMWLQGDKPKQASPEAEPVTTKND